MRPTHHHSLADTTPGTDYLRKNSTREITIIKATENKANALLISTTRPINLVPQPALPTRPLSTNPFNIKNTARFAYKIQEYFLTTQKATPGSKRHMTARKAAAQNTPLHRDIFSAISSLVFTSKAHHLSTPPRIIFHLETASQGLKRKAHDCLSHASRKTYTAPPSLTVGSTRTPTLAMASPSSWPVSVPCAFGSGAG